MYTSALDKIRTEAFAFIDYECHLSAAISCIEAGATNQQRSVKNRDKEIMLQVQHVNMIISLVWTDLAVVIKSLPVN